jgi:hypothetical protein
MATVTFSEDRVFILDFDDTLIPSSWLNTQGFKLSKQLYGVTATMLDACAKVAHHSAALINAAKGYGKVVIVTNATHDWVELASKMFMPSISDLILSLPIFSAADLYESRSTSPTIWKKLAFQNDVLRTVFPVQPAMRTVISIGDSEAERQALKYVQSLADPESMLTKSVKFRDKPTPESLIQQLVVTLEGLHMIATTPESLDLQIEAVETPSPLAVPLAVVQIPPLPPSPPPSPPCIPRVSSVFEPFSMFDDYFIPIQEENKN